MFYSISRKPTLRIAKIEGIAYITKLQVSIFDTPMFAFLGNAYFFLVFLVSLLLCNYAFVLVGVSVYYCVSCV